MDHPVSLYISAYMDISMYLYIWFIIAGLQVKKKKQPGFGFSSAVMHGPIHIHP